MSEIKDAGSGVVLEEIQTLTLDTVNRSWTRAFTIQGLPPMVTDRAKHKTFEPRKLVVELSRHNEEPPKIDKIVFQGPFTNDLLPGGMRIFRSSLQHAYDIPTDLRDLLQSKIDAVIEEVSGVPARDSIFAKLARRAAGWSTEPFTPAEEQLWVLYELLRDDPAKPEKEND